MSADRWVGWKLDSRPLFVGKDAEAVLLLRPVARLRGGAGFVVDQA